MSERKPSQPRGKRGPTKQGNKPAGEHARGYGQKGRTDVPRSSSSSSSSRSGGRFRPTGDAPAAGRGERQQFGRPSRGYGRPEQRRDCGRMAGNESGLAYVERGRDDRSAPRVNNRFGPNARPANSGHARPMEPHALPQQQDSGFQQEPENLLSGRNPIREALKANRDIEKILVASGDLSGSAREIVSMARKAGVIIQEVDRARLDQITRNHQGMVAYASAYSYSTVEEMLALAKERNEAPFLILLDKITDPQNLGAIVRTAACVGAHGVVVPLHRAVGLTPSAVRASAGAVEHVKVARVVNLNQLMKDLKRQGIWIYGADAEGTDMGDVNFDGPCALVVGSEGEGISEHTLSQCDHRVSIPMTGVIDSLNASVAAGVLMYAVYTGRRG